MPNTADNTTRKAKLNILSLPSYTSILFALVAFVVLGAAFASLLPGSQLCWPPIVLGLTLLPLRDFLQRPDRELGRWSMAHRGDEETTIIEDELASFETDNQPTVVTSDQPLEAHAFGSFRRAYLGMGRPLAEALSSGLRPSPDSADDKAKRRRDAYRAILAHEFAHFLNRDVWLMWLSYGLLKMMVLVMTLNLWVGINLAALIIEIGPEVMQPGFWDALPEQMLPGVEGVDLRPIYDSMVQENPYVVERLADPSQRIENWRPFFLNLTAAHWPFAAAGLILFFVYWHKLLRVRELYADARAASLMGEATILREARIIYGILVGFGATTSSRWGRMRIQFQRFLDGIPILNRLLARHPADIERRLCLHEPVRAFGPWWQVAILVGSAVALLDFLLRGTLTAAYIYQPGPHVPFLVGFLVFSAWLLPKVCLGVSFRRRFVWQVVLIISLFTVVRLLPQLLDAAAGVLMLASDPESLGAMLDLWAYSMFGGYTSEIPRIVGQEISWTQFIEWQLVRPIAYFALLMPPTLIALLMADATLKRRVLTWYRLGEQVRSVFWGISGLITLALALVVLPIFNRIFFPHIYEGWSVTVLLGMMVAIVSVGLAGLFFWHYDRQLAHRCAHCGELVPGSFSLARKCESCQKELHPWLTANY